MTRLLTALAVPVALLALGAGPALADAESRTDPAGDAPSPVDVTGVRVDHGSRRAVVEVDLPGLTDRGTVTVQYSDRRAGGLQVSVLGDGRTRLAYCRDAPCRRVTCPRLRARRDLAARRVSVSVPRRCYPGGPPRSAWFAVLTQAGQDRDFVSRFDVRAG